jgi:hypothetical protein
MIIEMNRPNQYNVSVGDTLIVPLGKQLARLDIRRFNQDFIFADNGIKNTAISNGIKATVTSYEEAIIRTQRGEYLFGEKAEARLFGEGFGGIRVIK